MTQGKGAFTPQKILTLDRTTAYVKQMLERQALGDGTGASSPASAPVTGVTARRTGRSVSLNESVFLKEGARVVSPTTTGDRANSPDRDVPRRRRRALHGQVQRSWHHDRDHHDRGSIARYVVSREHGLSIMYGAVREDAIRVPRTLAARCTASTRSSRRPARSSRSIRTSASWRLAGSRDRLPRTTAGGSRTRLMLAARASSARRCSTSLRPAW